MNEKLKALIADFNAKSAKRDELLGKGEAITQEDIEAVKLANEELKGIQTQITDLRSLVNDSEELKKFASDPVLKMPVGAAQAVGMIPAGQAQVTTNEQGAVIEGDCLGIPERQQKAIQTDGYKRAFIKYCRGFGMMDALDAIDRKTLQEGIDSSGGYLVPVDILNRIIQKKPAPTRVNGRVTRLQTSRDLVSMPRVVYATDDIYTTGVRATNTGEIPSSSTAARVTDPVFGQTQIQIGTWMLSMPLTNDVVEDSAFPLLNWASGKFDETIGLLYDNQIENGTGVGSNPHGILKNPGGTDEPGVTLSGTADNIDADQLRKIPFDVPEQYINDNTCWVMNRGNCGKAVSLLKDSQNRYLFLDGQTYPGLVGRSPDQLAGYPIVYSAFMPDIGDGKFPLIFGDLRGYYLVERIAFSVQILRELYAETNQLLMLGRLRFGGVVAEPFTLRIGKSDNA
jgi:HK97 family phage major capsid protein